MAIHKTSQDRTKTWTVTSDGDLWVVEEDAHFKVDGAGIDVNGFSNTRIRVFGDISTINSTSPGIIVDAADTDILVGASSKIEVGGAAAGILSDGLNTDAVNHGRILSGEYGIVLGNGGKVTNTGIIRGEQGVDLSCKDDDRADIANDGLIFGSDAAIRVRGFNAVQTQNTQSDQLLQRDVAGPSIINNDEGIIRSDGYGIVFEYADGNRLVNEGLIRAPKAVFDVGVDTTVINHGRIVGNILLEGGDDHFDGRGGRLDGTVYGGSGSDVYILSDNTTISEGFLQGLDTLKSTISATLPSNVENLVLLGDALTGTGNGQDNKLIGSGSANHLIGYQGDDTLDGRKGNDVLEGHQGNDVFVFNKGYGKDTILDFEDGSDKLEVAGMTSISDYSAFDDRIQQVGTNVEIDLGNGNVLTIKNLSKADISVSDFEF